MKIKIFNFFYIFARLTRAGLEAAAAAAAAAVTVPAAPAVAAVTVAESESLSSTRFPGLVTRFPGLVFGPFPCPYLTHSESLNQLVNYSYYPVVSESLYQLVNYSYYPVVCSKIVWNPESAI